jgi:hypothetical protein
MEVKDPDIVEGIRLFAALRKTDIRIPGVFQQPVWGIG